MKNNAFGQWLTYIFFPNRCAFCDKVMPPSESICKACGSTLPWIDGETCMKCGRKTEDCDCGRHNGNFYDGVASTFYYEGSVRDCIGNFKFRSEKYLGETLGDLMVHTCKNHYNDIKFDYVAYVPLDRRRQRKRGYNQSRILAQRISEKIGVPLGDELIRKIYHTAVQHECSRIERKGNLLGAFDINESYNVDGKTILLVDDVKTSGATLNECGKMLYLNGAKSVFCLTTATVNSKIDGK